MKTFNIYCSGDCSCSIATKNKNKVIKIPKISLLASDVNSDSFIVRKPDEIANKNFEKNQLFNNCTISLQNLGSSGNIFTNV